MSKRNRHPFEGDRKRAAGTLRLWTGRGAGYSPHHKRLIPLDALTVVANVPDVRTANAYIQRVSRTAKGGNMKKLTGTGFENAVFIEELNTWWMVT